MIPDPLGRAARLTASGGLLAYPTETVWGLGTSAESADGVERLRRWKGRGHDAPLSVLVDGVAGAEELGCRFDPPAHRLAASLWPGALTLVLPCQRSFAPGVARADGGLGLRCSSHPLAMALARRLRRAGDPPITATSLNRSGDEPARSREQARALCRGTDDPRLLCVEEAEAGGERATTVVDLTGARPRVLRWGALGPDAFQGLLPELAR